MRFSFRYGAARVMQRIDVESIPLESDSYVRNVLAYIPRNALDNGGNVSNYPWTGYGAMFNPETLFTGRSTSSLTKREKGIIMHTADKLDDTKWILDDKLRLIAKTWCDYEYLEQAFENDSAYFLKTIGSVNVAEMYETLVENPRKRLQDSEFYKYANNLCIKWFRIGLQDASVDIRLRLATFMYRTMRTTVPQLARILSLDREKIALSIGKKKG